MRPHRELSNRINVVQVGDDGGAYTMYLGGAFLRIIASFGEGWDHVSVSLEKRCPTWAEMEAVKRAFFYPNEVAMQLHVATADHINRHPYTLHMWRPHDQPIPLPPIHHV